MVECGGLRAASRNARFLLRKVFAMIFETSLQTPPLPAECGGFCSHTRRPPHSIRLHGAYICEEADQNLGGFCQDLDRLLAISGRILPHKMKPRSQNKIQRNYQKSSNHNSQNTKIHQNCQKLLSSRTISPHDRKRTDKDSIIPRFWGPPEHRKSAKVKKKRSQNSTCF